MYIVPKKKAVTKRRLPTEEVYLRNEGGIESAIFTLKRREFDRLTTAGRHLLKQMSACEETADGCL